MQTLRREQFVFALCLAAMAGYVDAFGFITLAGNFVSFMTGNTTRLAVALGGSSASTSLLPGLITLVFVFGVMGGSVIAHFCTQHRAAAVLFFLTTCLFFASMLEPVTPVYASVLLAIGMGAANSIYDKSGEVQLGVTYMTGTLVKVGQRLTAMLWGGSKTSWLRPAGLWFSLLAGGVLGTLAHQLFGNDGMIPLVIAAIGLTATAYMRKY